MLSNIELQYSSPYSLKTHSKVGLFTSKHTHSCTRTNPPSLKHTETFFTDTVYKNTQTHHILSLPSPTAHQQTQPYLLSFQFLSVAPLFRHRQVGNAKINLVCGALVCKGIVATLEIRKKSQEWRDQLSSPVPAKQWGGGGGQRGGGGGVKAHSC